MKPELEDVESVLNHLPSVLAGIGLILLLAYSMVKTRRVKEDRGEGCGTCHGACGCASQADAEEPSSPSNP